MDTQYLLRVMKRMAIPVLFLSAVLLTSLTLSCYLISTNTLIEYKIEIWTNACPYIDFFLPLIVCVVFVPFIFMQTQNSFIRYASTRIRRKHYIFTQILSVILFVSMSVSAAYFLSLVISLALLKPQAIGTGNHLLSYVFGNYQVHHPYLFGFAWCLWKGIMASAFAAFGCFLALSIDNLFVAVLLPFLYCMAENLITALLNIPQYSVMTSYVLNRLSPSCMSIWNYLIGAITFTMFAAITIFIVSRKTAEWRLD